MSDGKEVKRWEPCLKDSPAGTYVTTKETKRVRNVYVTIEDHDRIVADLRAEVERYKNLYEDYSSEVEELQHERRNLETTIAAQAKVIEKLKACAVFYSTSEFPWSNESEFDNGAMADETLAELDALEQEKEHG